MSKIRFVHYFASGFSLLFLCVVIFLLIDKRILASKKIIISPLSDSLSRLSSQTLGAKISWQPKIDHVFDDGVKKPNITAISALSYDLTSDTLLFARDIKKRLPIASLTKITTLLVALENEDIHKTVKVSKGASSIGENVMGLSEGEELTLENLLYGLTLVSGNDAAEAIAEGSSVGRDNFIFLMNKKAEDLGLSDTHLTNPSGLEGDGNQYSSAYDLLVLSAYGLKNEMFRQIVSTVEYEIPQSSTHKAYHLFNETNLLTSYPGVKGVKIGFTPEAGYCIVTYLEYGGHKIIAVLLNSESRRQEMKDLLDYSLKTLGVEPPPHS